MYVILLYTKLISYDYIILYYINSCFQTSLSDSEGFEPSFPLIFDSDTDL